MFMKRLWLIIRIATAGCADVGRFRTMWVDSVGCGALEALALADSSARGDLVIAACRSGKLLARGIVAHYERLAAHEGDGGGHGVLVLEDIDSRFSDTETSVQLSQDVSGRDAFIVQALHDPTAERSIDDNYAALLIAVRACREWGANQVTAVLPYLAYARQDKPAPGRREPTTAKLMADLAITAGIDRLVTWHPHLRQIHGFYGKTPVVAVDSLALFLRAFERFGGREDVIAVSPDAGALKFVSRFARALDLPSAIGSKVRPRPEEAEISELMGNVAGKRTAIVLDDMISSGGTMVAVVEALYEQAALEKVYVAVSHNLCLEAARERLLALHERFGVAEVLVTNTIPQTEAFRALPFVRMLDVADVLAQIIYRVHHNQALGELLGERGIADSTGLGGR